MQTGEREPLLSNQRNMPPPVPVQTGPPTAGYSQNYDAPPPYSELFPNTTDSASGSSQMDIVCDVCRATLTIRRNRNALVAKCHICGEATAIRPPPIGKKFARCSCNALLLCNDTDEKVFCPRSHCRRVLTLRPTARIICAYCNYSSECSPSQAELYNCSNCQKKSFTSIMFRSKFLLRYCMLLAVLICFVIGAITLLVLFPIGLGITIAISFFFGVILIPFGCKLYSFYQMPTSEIEAFCPNT